MAAVELVERRPTVDEYRRLIAAVGWKPRDPEAIALALEASIFSFCAELDGTAIGMGRVIGDGGLHYYLTDIVVDPTHQRSGVGGRLVKALTERVEGVPVINTWVRLFPVEGTPDLYARFGYKGQRPNRPAMDRWLHRS